MRIEALHELLSPHAQVGTEGGDTEADEECLVADDGAGGIACNGLASHFGPCLDEPLLQQRCLESQGAQIAQHQIAYVLFSSLKHLLSWIYG